MVVLLVREGVAHAQLVEDGVVGVALAVLFEDGLAEHLGGHLLVGGEVIGVGETAGVVHGRVDGQALAAAEVVVVRAVAGRDVDDYRSPDGREARTGYQSNTLLAKYRESHLHPTNEVIHFVCVPVIMFTLLGLLWSLHPLVALAFSIATLAIGAVAYRFTRARQMVRQYPWLYRRKGLLDWEERH